MFNSNLLKIDLVVWPLELIFTKTTRDYLLVREPQNNRSYFQKFNFKFIFCLITIIHSLYCSTSEKVNQDFFNNQKFKILNF